VLVGHIFCILQVVACCTISKCKDISIPIIISKQKLQKMGFGLHDLLPHFVLLRLHMFFCFCVGWVVNSFLGGKGVS